MINDILDQVKMNSINETLMKQQTEDKAMENQSNLEKLSQNYISSLQTTQIDTETPGININIPNSNSNTNPTKIAPTEKKKVNYTLDLNSNKIYILNKEKVEFRFTREGDFMNASLTGECWMKYDPSLEFDTVMAKIVGYDTKPEGIKAHPNVDKDL